VKTTRSLSRFLLGMMLASASCGGKGDADDLSGWKVTNEGTGEAAEGLLSPTWAGIRREFESGLVTTAVGPTERFGRSTVRFQGSNDIRFFRQTDTGLYYDGSLRIGELTPPILLVPKTVKDGMQWQQIGVEGKVLGTFDVKALGPQPTPFGIVKVWRVTQTNEVTKNQFVNEYAEGYGVVKADADTLVAAVVPKAARPTKQQPPRVQLTPIGDGTRIAESFGAETASLIVPASGPGTLRIGGKIAWYENLGADHWVEAPAVGCAKLEGTALSGFALESFTMAQSTGSAAKCAEANGAAFDASGQLVQVAVTAAGVAEHGVGGIFLEEDGVMRGIGVHEDPWLLEHWGRTGLPMVLPDGRIAYPDESSSGGELDIAWLHVGTRGAILSPTVKATATVPFVFRRSDRLLWSRSSTDGFASPTLVGTVPGGLLSTRLDPSGRRHLLVTRDGIVDELRITDTGAELVRLAELELPEGHELFSALPVGDSLFVLTRADHVAPPALQQGQPDMGDVFAFTAKIPTAPADPAAYEGPNADELNIVAKGSGPDVELCFRTGATVSTEGWSIAKKPARGFAIDGPGTCILLVRDQSTTVDFTAPDAWLVEGNAPGVGAVTIAVRNDDVGPVADQLAAIKGGGFASPSLRYSSFGTPLGPQKDAASRGDVSEHNGNVDVSGNGQWRSDIYWTECGELGSMCNRITLSGASRQRFIVPYASRFQNVVAGGGVILVHDISNQTILGPDGVETVLPLVPSYAQTLYFMARNDGLGCGKGRTATNLPFEQFCREPNGTVHTAPLTTSYNIETLWPGKGGWYAANNEGPFMGFMDPSTAIISDLPLEDYTAPISERDFITGWSAEGDLYVFVAPVDPSEPRTLLKLADGKATKVPLPSTLNSGVLPSVSQLLVGPEIITLVGGTAATYFRLPR